jgi:Flp pilus assembly protein TadD
MTSIADALAAALRDHQAGRLQGAERAYLEVLAAEPRQPDALHYLGVIAYQTGRLDAAADYLARAAREIPDTAALHHHLGLVHAAQGRAEEAIASFGQALRLAPELAEAHNGLGNALKDLGRPEEALGNYRRALELKPDFADAHSNLGNTLELLGRYAEAAGAYRRALELDPNHAAAHWNQALLMLLRGDLERGWDEYEWRWKTRGFIPRTYPQPLWDGSTLAGKTVLVHCEQGLGDTIQFIRYAPLLRARGATVVFECQRRLLALLAGCTGVDVLVGEGDSLPAFDVFAPLLSLPRILATRLASIPAAAGYLAPRPELAAQWRARLAHLGGYPIGIAWQGRTAYAKDRYRSVPLSHFAPLAELPGVRLISLQTGAGRDQIRRLARPFPLTDFGEALDGASGPFMDTAAILSGLRLVITSDTAIAHLAGAMGVPVWVALSFAPDWRWHLDRNDSPWYATMRLFRQKRLGDWSSVFEEIRAALQERMRAGA